ncbi:unnamed protein product [Trichobilharzia szidati]|nr:unnamed protein product [Trichobilharzia szidati]
MESKAAEISKRLSLPQSVFIDQSAYQHLAKEYWLEKCSSHPEYELLKPSENEQLRPISSFSSNLLRETYQLLAEWRLEARKRVESMSEEERRDILASVGVEAFSKEKLSSKNENNNTDHHAENSSPKTSSNSASEKISNFSSLQKRKSSQLVRGARLSKFGRLSTYPSNSLSPRKYHNKPVGKRHDLSKMSSVDEKLKKHIHNGTTPQYIDDDDEEGVDDDDDDDDDDEEEEEEEEDEEEEDEEDQLTAIISRQRQAFSARAAAGRPSIREMKSNSQKKPISPPFITTGSSSVPAARRLSAKVLRAWKSLAKKEICKLARQRIAIRRDKIAMAKRAARECARLLRQKALLSQKASKDSINRGHRLSREIALSWRSSASSIANGSGPLTINGITMPSSSNTTHSSSCMNLPDYYTSVGSEGGGAMDLNASVTMMESSTAARRRAEKAAAEQRKADLELLEARRQQRKLNFLITQTELYAHFMAKKMADVNIDNCKFEGDSENPEALPNNASQEDGLTEEEEARRILRRLEEVDDDSVETKTNDDGTDTGSDISAPMDSIQNDQDYSSITTGSKMKKSYSSIAVAAKAAASRLGINVEEEYDIERVKSEALMKVKVAVTTERNRVSQFHPLPPTNQNPNTSATNAAAAATTTTITTSTDANTTTVQVEAPKLFKGQLKAYQIRGLNWLLGLFDQGINGILADEMGLGKTIQTIAFLGCLAENYNIWGPFLIVTPSSTLHNWTQEFAKFLPDFRLVPYWGTPTERKVLRRFWSSKRSSNSEEGFNESSDINFGQVGVKDSQLHVVVTSYQVVLQDAKFINKTAWSYIVLDEAHAIKSTSSLRWKILLSFKCRNRLLLTGTPIQNTMQELWALLHFIMPTLFDSHDEFANWFSRDIESQASATARTGVTGGGGGGALITSKLNENQLSRLHLILKPFMLRRTKTEVEHEISTKTEIMLYCPLSCRQQILYERLRNKIRLEDLSSIMSSDAYSSTSTMDSLNSSSSATAHLINLVMQLRKVCNHPDLWERRDVNFSCIAGQIEPNSCQNLCNSEIKYCNSNTTGIYNNCNRCTDWRLPNLLYEEDTLSAFSWRRRSLTHLYSNWPISLEFYSLDLLIPLTKYFCLHHPYYIQEDLWHHDTEEPDLGPACLNKLKSNCTKFVPKCFSFARLLGLSVGEYVKMIQTGGGCLLIPESESTFEREWISCSESIILRNYFNEVEDTQNGKISTILRLNPFFPMSSTHTSSNSVAQLRHLHGLLLHPIVCESSLFESHVPSVFISSPGKRPYIPNFTSLATIQKVLITPLSPYINTANFNTSHIQSIPYCPPNNNDNNTPLQKLNLIIPLPRSLELVSRTTRISDSGKLTALDNLLTELKSNGHRVLIYSQMTRMIDILEEFMLYRKHAYLRLDGSSRLSDRRDMVAQWQTNPHWFVFLLSTRAGGLGINLTAADTVIFYDSDWNPTVDQQAMDRAHRLGQTKPVTVYRLICKNTVEGRMLLRAEEKRAMQQMVIQSGQGGLGNLLPSVTNRSGSTDHMTSSDMVSLLLDDDELVKRLQVRKRLQPQRGRPAKNNPASRLITSTTVQATSTHGNTSNADTKTCTTGQLSGGNINSMELNLSFQRNSDIVSNVGENLLERKRQAAWAEQARSGRVKRIRPSKAIGPATIVSSNDSISNCTPNSNNNNNNLA